MINRGRPQVRAVGEGALLVGTSLTALLLASCQRDGHGELPGAYGDEFGEVASALWIEASRETWRTVHPSQYDVAVAEDVEILIPRLLVTSRPLSCQDLRDQVAVVGAASAVYVAEAGESAPIPESCEAFDRFIESLVEEGIEAIPRPYVSGGPTFWVSGSGREPVEGPFDLDGSTSTWRGPSLADAWDSGDCDMDLIGNEILTLTGTGEITAVRQDWVELTVSGERYNSSGSEQDPYEGPVEALLTARRCEVEVPEVWVW